MEYRRECMARLWSTQERPVLATAPTQFNAIKLSENLFLLIQNKKKENCDIYRGGGEKKRVKMPQGPCSAGEMRICVFNHFQNILTKYVLLLFLSG